MVDSVNLLPSTSQNKFIKDGWFTEDDQESFSAPGQRFSLEVEEVLLNGKSKFQDILVFKSKTYGTVMALDGMIQVSERDEFAYQEMIAHLPMFACKDPKKVLIVGGGDGGVLREVAKHPGVTEIHMCEIDDQVIAVGKKYFRDSLATAFDDPRLKLIIDDADRYLREEGAGQDYDVIICDSSDPVGPADVLFQPAFFENMFRALKPGSGVITTQCECQWLYLDFIEKKLSEMRKIFPSAHYAYTTIPTYASGQIGFLVATADPTASVNVPTRSPGDMDLKYYSSNMHGAAFILPSFAEKRLGKR